MQMMADHTRSTGGIDFDPDDDFNPFSEDEVGPRRSAKLSHATHSVTRRSTDLDRAHPPSRVSVTF